MIDINSIVIDSAMSFAEAVDGSTAPLEVIDSLSMVDVTYYSFDGLRHSGQIVVDAGLEDDIYEIFQMIERLKFPVGKAIPIAAYHWEDGDSMADNNSSGFNFRVIADTNKLSLHSFGRAVDINPVQNPVIYPAGIIAPAGALYRPQNNGTFTTNHPVVQDFIKRGWHWGGNFEQPKDYHHFEKT
jgi:hypothetical protein